MSSNTWKGAHRRQRVTRPRAEMDGNSSFSWRSSQDDRRDRRRTGAGVEVRSDIRVEGAMLKEKGN